MRISNLQPCLPEDFIHPEPCDELLMTVDPGVVEAAHDTVANLGSAGEAFDLFCLAAHSILVETRKSHSWADHLEEIECLVGLRKDLEAMGMRVFWTQKPFNRNAEVRGWEGVHELAQVKSRILVLGPLCDSITCELPGDDQDPEGWCPWDDLTEVLPLAVA